MKLSAHENPDSAENLLVNQGIFEFWKKEIKVDF